MKLTEAKAIAEKARTQLATLQKLLNDLTIVDRLETTYRKRIQEIIDAEVDPDDKATMREGSELEFELKVIPARRRKTNVPAVAAAEALRDTADNQLRPALIQLATDEADRKRDEIAKILAPFCDEAWRDHAGVTHDTAQRLASGASVFNHIVVNATPKSACPGFGNLQSNLGEDDPDYFKDTADRRARLIYFVNECLAIFDRYVTGKESFLAKGWQNLQAAEAKRTAAQQKAEQTMQEAIRMRDRANELAAEAEYYESPESNKAAKDAAELATKAEQAARFAAAAAA
jgi:hypothetical protein